MFIIDLVRCAAARNRYIMLRNWNAAGYKYDVRTSKRSDECECDWE